MTIQVTNHNKSKQTLQDALNTDATKVYFNDPSIFNPRYFNGADMKLGERFAVVMDHPKRSKFAQVTRKADGKGFKVS